MGHFLDSVQMGVFPRYMWPHKMAASRPGSIGFMLVQIILFILCLLCVIRKDGEQDQ